MLLSAAEIAAIHVVLDMTDCFSECWCNYWKRWLKYKQIAANCKCSLMICYLIKRSYLKLESAVVCYSMKLLYSYLLLDHY